MYEDKKIENLNNAHIAQFTDTVIQVILKLFCRILCAYSFAQFLYCNLKNL